VTWADLRWAYSIESAAISRLNNGHGSLLIRDGRDEQYPICAGQRFCAGRPTALADQTDIISQLAKYEIDGPTPPHVWPSRPDVLKNLITITPTVE